MNEALRAKARCFFSEILERPGSIRALKGAVLWPRKYKKGVSLFEIIIAIVIISIAVLGLVTMFQMSLKGGVSARYLTVAAGLAEEKMEEVLRLGYANITNQGPSSFSSPFSDYQYRVIWHYVQSTNLSTSVDPTVTEYKNVLVNVTHANMAAVTLNSLLTDNLD
ncbi:MAG: prepilin-type N-terminal cleavage/methylation domain-containing protein [Candidatus Omnitrophica bacterium]|nr:prepilin-type N-terminal cleavage/methylation domain-containing protein [Candidatus Omnitrophota bacterium]MBU1869229.1 prepilin-type N-terminal cleavage/methylation domain-containing protein [Candidatus Omnitrophota bacterium]